MHACLRADVRVRVCDYNEPFVCARANARACEQDDPFVCDVTGALIDMKKDGRYHFDDGRTPDDPSAVCMVIHERNKKRKIEG